LAHAAALPIDLISQGIANRYPDGSVSFAPHHDAGAPLLIFSASFGAPRSIGFCQSGATLDPSLPTIELSPGSLLIIPGGTNAVYKHGIVAGSAAIGLRISVTMRVFGISAEVVKWNGD
jgi:alkylated DNA repair dioxygenase AlkB